MTEVYSGLFASTSFTVTVTNAPPQVSITGAPASSPEGTAIALGSSVTDPSPSDTLTCAWTVLKNGSPYASGSGTDITFTPNDNGTYTVTLTVTDDDGGVGTDTRTITVANVDPTTNVGGAPAGTQGVAFSSTGSHTDAGTADTHTYQWTVIRDGQPVDLTGYATTGATFTYTPTEPGTYVATLAVTDDDGGAGTAARTVVVAAGTGPVVADGRLIIYGTSGNDDIQVTPGGGPSDLKVRLNGVQQTFVGVTEIVIYANDGDDDVHIVGGVTMPAFLFGGAGNDNLRAGGGTSVLVGGDGNDDLLGGSAGDVLIGGLGADHLSGKDGDDLLVAGYTLFDANLTALGSIRSEWTSARSFSQRVANLSGLTVPGADGSTFGARANGGVFLRADGANRTVFDDGAADELTGDGGDDWFLFNSVGGPWIDIVTDPSGFEDLFDTDL